MRTTTKLLLLSAVLLLSRVFAQQEGPSGFYRLDLVAKELDDNKVITTRSYSMIVSDKVPASIRTGSRVPMYTRSGPNAEEFTYIDLGVNIDCRDIKETSSGQLSLTVSTDISTAAADEARAPVPAVPAGPPVIRQYKWSSAVLVPLRKATQIFSSDDLGSKRKFQIELTVTPVK